MKTKIIRKERKQKYPTNKIDVYSFDDTWSLDIIDLNDYGLEDNRCYRCVVVVIDNFSKFGKRFPLKKMPKQHLFFLRIFL